MSDLNASAAGKHRGCPHCGHLLRYDMASGKLKCTACGQHTELSYYDPAPEEAKNGTMSVLEYRCPQCGAAVHTTETNLISYCNHCGSEVLFTERMTETQRPDWIVPFRISREECEAIYREHMEKAVFAPDTARKAVEAQYFQPIYVPFYLHEGVLDDCANLTYEQQEGDLICTYSQKLKCNITVGPEAHCAAPQMDPILADQLSFSTEMKVPFSPAYLCGFYAEAPDMWAVSEQQSHLAEYMKTYTLQVARDANVAGADKGKAKIGLPKEIPHQTRMILLPVWLLGEKQGERMLYTAIDGSDGSIVCETPIQHRKVYTLGAILGVLLAVVFMLLSSAIILRAKLLVGLCAVLVAAGYYVVEGTLKMHRQREEGMEQRRQMKIAGRLSKEEVWGMVRQRQLNKDDRKTAKRQAIALGVLLVLGLTPAYPLAFVGLILPVVFCIMEGVEPHLRQECWKMHLASLVVTCVVFVVPAVNLLGWRSVSLSNMGSAPGVCCLVIVGMILVSVVMGREYIGDKTYTLLDWCKRHLIPMLGIGLVVMSLFWITQKPTDNQFVAGLVSDKGWLAPFLCAASAVSVFCGMAEGYDGETRHWSTWVLTVVLAALGALLLIVSDQRFCYGAALALIALLIFLTARLTNKHNDFVTRPVPYFGKRKEAGQ